MAAAVRARLLHAAMPSQTASAMAALGADRYAAMNAEEFFVSADEGDAVTVAAG